MCRLEELVKLLMQDPAAPPNPNFRLWLVTEASPLFPATLLQMGVRLVWEAPQVCPP